MKNLHPDDVTLHGRFVETVLKTGAQPDPDCVQRYLMCHCLHDQNKTYNDIIVLC